MKESGIDQTSVIIVCFSLIAFGTMNILIGFILKCGTAGYPLGMLEESKQIQFYECKIDYLKINFEMSQIAVVLNQL